MGGMVAASLLVYRAMAPFEGAIIVWKNFIGARDAFRRLNKALAGHSEPRGTTSLPTPTGALSVENLYYQPPKTQAILRSISFSLNAGESLGVIGPSAAGKSTLAKCVMGIYPPTFGHVRLDGSDVFTWDREDFGQYVGFLPQDVELFPGTIKQNIARMQPLPSDIDVIEAAKIAGVHEMVLRLPKGYDTEITSGHGGLSPGQRQRIGLARAAYGSPKLVVLDEPNSNLDGEGELALIAALRHLKQQKCTCIIIAHRPSVLQAVDTVMLLNNGMVEAIGARDEILSRFSADVQRKIKEKQLAAAGANSAPALPSEPRKDKPSRKAPDASEDQA
jgi:PrtD family type I secretion system ABC transporter